MLNISLILKIDTFRCKKLLNAFKTERMNELNRLSDPSHQEDIRELLIVSYFVI